MILRRDRSWYALLVTGLLTLPILFPQLANGATRRQRAQAAYERAVRLRAELASRRADVHLKAKYEKVIQTFRSVHRLDPSYGRAPVALAAVGELYAEMGRRFSNQHYHRAAIRAYEYLIAEYPRASMSRGALLAIGEIYLSDLGSPEEAKKTYQQSIEKYPRFRQAAEAKQKLKAIERLLAERQAAKEALAAARPPGKLAEVTGIRRWVGPNYSRIVINLEGEVRFETTRLPNPDRIVLDLASARLSSALLGKTYPVEDGFLRQIRIGQYQPNVARVVLDVEEIEDYSVFTLPNPFRLVIDINGPSRPTTELAKTAAPAKKLPGAPKETPETSAGKAAEGAAKAPTKPVATETTSVAGSQVMEPRDAAPSPKSEPPPGSETRETASVEAPPLPTPEAPKAEPPIKPAAPTASGARTLTRALGLKISRIVIDPGHGGHDTGTIGPTGATEKDVVLDVALRLKALVESKMGAEVVMTRGDDTFIPLEERTAIANEKAADLFISVHANASRSRSARGIETYYLNFTSNPEALEVAARENATSQESVYQLQNLIQKIALTEKIQESQEFAAHVQREVHSRLMKMGAQQRNRGVKKAPFVVLIGANMPSILAEISFLTNPQDERLLKRKEHRQRIAEALFAGVSRYVDKLGGVRATQQAARQTSSASLSDF